MIQDWRKKTALKRGGDETLLRLDFDDADRRYSLEPSDSLTPERLFDRKWAIQVLEQVIQELEDYYVTRDKKDLFDALKPHLVRQSNDSWRDVSTELGMNEIAVKVAAHRMRQKYRSILYDLIAQTVDTKSEIDKEIADLFSALSEDPKTF